MFTTVTINESVNKLRQELAQELLNEVFLAMSYNYEGLNVFPSESTTRADRIFSIVEEYQKALDGLVAVECALAG